MHRGDCVRDPNSDTRTFNLKLLISQQSEVVCSAKDLNSFDAGADPFCLVFTALPRDQNIGARDRFGKVNFQMAQDGVEALHEIKNKSGNTTVHKIWICGPMEQIAQSRTDENEN